MSGATLWDPLEIIGANDGCPPLTYAQFCHVTRAVGPPPRPLPDVDLKVGVTVRPFTIFMCFLKLCG